MLSLALAVWHLLSFRTLFVCFELGADKDPKGRIFMVGLGVAILASPVLGLILGIVGACLKGRRKLYVVLGLVLNVLIILGWAGMACHVALRP
jgi:hypothetical protein